MHPGGLRLRRGSLQSDVTASESLISRDEDINTFLC